MLCMLEASIAASLAGGFTYLLCSIRAWITGSTVTCCGCSMQHSRRNTCDNSFSAFCTDACFTLTMQRIDNGALIGDHYEGH